MSRCKLFTKSIFIIYGIILIAVLFYNWHIPIIEGLSDKMENNVYSMSFLSSIGASDVSGTDVSGVDASGVDASGVSSNLFSFSSSTDASGQIHQVHNNKQ